MGVRLEPRDEYMHELGPEPNFNESMYFNVYDPAEKVGGFFRLGNRANEGSGEMTACLYLPDARPERPSERGNRVGFMFKRPEITSNDAFDAAGMRFEVVTPFEELTVSYRGKVVMLDDPLQMADPKAAFTDNPYEEAEVDLTYTRVSDMFGGEPEESHEAPDEEFAKGHYEQLNRATGRIRVGEQEWSVDGYGLRDHSWGPRYWQAPWYYRWLTCNAGDGFGFMASRVARRDGDGTRGGFVWEDGKLHLCGDARISTQWTGDDVFHDRIELHLASKDKAWKVSGTVLSLIPLRNRREDPNTGELLVTRISEGMTEWTIEGVDQPGYGLSEYLDQLIDGKPVGADE